MLPAPDHLTPDLSSFQRRGLVRTPALNSVQELGRPENQHLFAIWKRRHKITILTEITCMTYRNYFFFHKKPFTSFRDSTHSSSAIKPLNYPTRLQLFKKTAFDKDFRLVQLGFRLPLSDLSEHILNPPDVSIGHSGKHLSVVLIGLFDKSGIAKPKEMTSRPQPLSTDSGSTNCPSADLGPKLKMAIRQPQTMMTTKNSLKKIIVLKQMEFKMKTLKE